MELVEYYTQNQIGYITLNRPAQQNALNPGLLQQLQAAFTQAEADAACKVIVLKAKGEVFCVGADLNNAQTADVNAITPANSNVSQLPALLQQIYTLKKVVIAQVQGPAISDGCGLAAVCDLAFAVPAATFGFTEVKTGLIPAIISVFLVRKIGAGKTKRLLLSGDLISADEAQTLGLINFVVPTEDLEKTVAAFADKISRENATELMATTKEIINDVQTMTLAEGLAYAAEKNTFARITPASQRDMAAFLEKKKIYW